jgi:hypothetical protein
MYANTFILSWEIINELYGKLIRLKTSITKDKWNVHMAAAILSCGITSLFVINQGPMLSAIIIVNSEMNKYIITHVENVILKEFISPFPKS